MKTIVWYFDFISPFAYLQFAHHEKLRQLAKIEYRPVLFAGLLGHWGQKGPAEIPGKRLFTYQHTLWMARKAGIPMRYPPGHPFNPLRALRLCLLLKNRPEAVGAIFNFIWKEGQNLADDPAFQSLCSQLEVRDPEAINQQEIKDALKQSTAAAAAAGVFGVPTFMVDGHLIWGLDATDMVSDALADPDLFNDPEMARIKSLPVSASRS